MSFLRNELAGSCCFMNSKARFKNYSIILIKYGTQFFESYIEELCPGNEAKRARLLQDRLNIFCKGL